MIQNTGVGWQSVHVVRKQRGFALMPTQLKIKISIDKSQQFIIRRVLQTRPPVKHPPTGEKYKGGAVCSFATLGKSSKILWFTGATIAPGV
jgi:hypothetical protein